MNGPDDLSVVWTRGKGCLELAEALSGSSVNRITGDLTEACIDHRADILVSKKLPGSFDLVSVAVPVDFDPDNVTSVVATVAGGPHSVLAAETADQIGRSLGVGAEMVSVTAQQGDRAATHTLLDNMAVMFPNMESRVIETDDGVSGLVESLDDGALLVIGAPGGSWLQRARFGPGARLRRTAQAGAVIVRSAPDRVFRFMGDPVYVAPLRLADDTLLLHPENTLAVAEDGRLVGLVRRAALQAAGDAPVGSVMEEAVSVRQDVTITEAWELEPTFGPDPIPVTDDEEHLVGGLSLRAG